MLVCDRNMRKMGDEEGKNAYRSFQWKKQYGEHLLEFFVAIAAAVYFFLLLSLWMYCPMCVRNNDFTVVICTTERESV